MFLVREREIQSGFVLRGHRLIPGSEGEVGLPLEAFLRLYAVRGTEKPIRIDGPADLAPLVSSIDDEEAAWRFLRLFTAPETSYLFHKDCWLIELRSRSSGEAAVAGTVDPAIARAAGLSPPTMAVTPDGYIAEHDLFCASPSEGRTAGKVCRRREYVARSGVYRVLDHRIVGRLDPADVVLPRYE
jgi:hypothetical protein